ncbi:hypothetical protein HBDW_33440 [Herbaspirillum sp. DW155]|nr:hypothetical protein HBDW_33440 [Herbaspirillum sp. DW155]
MTRPQTGILADIIEESFTSAFNHHAAGRLSTRTTARWRKRTWWNG